MISIRRPARLACPSEPIRPGPRAASLPHPRLACLAGAAAPPPCPPAPPAPREPAPSRRSSSLHGPAALPPCSPASPRRYSSSSGVTPARRRRPNPPPRRAAPPLLSRAAAPPLRPTAPYRPRAAPPHARPRRRVCSFSSPTLLRFAPSVLLRAAPHAATFRILTAPLCRANRPAAAADLPRCMPALLDPDPDHCCAVLASLCRCGPAQDALPFLDDMRRWCVSPTRPDHHAVIDALLREGKAAEAYEVVAKQMDADGVASGLPEFERMLRAFIAGREFDATEEVFDEMLLRGLMPDVGVYNVYVGALCG
ncbi:hypothetical protein ACP70R_049450 [Stipagrostis hirtigluma subsp. patula]